MYKLMTAILLAGFIAMGTVAAQDSDSDTPTEVAPAADAKGTDVAAPKLKRLKGELTLSWIISPGSKVEKGAVVAKIVVEGADRQMKSAKRGVTVIELQLASLNENARSSGASAVRELKRAEEMLERAKEALEFFKAEGKAQRIRKSEISIESRSNNVKDQEEELAQLTKLYAANELGQESQDIVLNRSRRRLKLSKESQKLGQKNHKRLIDVELVREQEDLEYKLEKANDSLTSDKFRADNGNIELKIKIIGTEAKLEDAKQAVTELNKDIAMLVIKAPVAGTIQSKMKDGKAVKSGKKVCTIVEG